MAKIPFNVDANTARLIGRENVSKSDGAIIEIIKNVIFFYILKTDVTKNPYRLDKSPNFFFQFCY